MLQELVINTPFELERGGILPSLTVAYHTYGTLKADKSNVIWVCHALTANTDVADWWSGLVGPGRCFDPNNHFIVCANMLGSCYGSSGPLTINPLTGSPYYFSFPEVTVRDCVRALMLLADHLGIDRIGLLLGGSMGGQQAMEWAILQPERIQRLGLLATNAYHSPWGIGFNAAQRLALEADQTLYDDSPDAGQRGLMAARAIAILSYRSYAIFEQTQPRDEGFAERGLFRADSYVRYQGEKLVRRFNAQSYRLLTLAMDSHDVGRGRGSVAAALARISAQTLVIGISSDILFPVSEQQFLAKYIPNVRHFEIDSPYGHDGFLVEFEKISKLITAFMN